MSRIPRPNSQKGDFKRRKSSRLVHLKILIVCEGEKTEVNYFKEAVEHFDLLGNLVKVCGKCGSDPKSVFNHAKKIANDDDYDKVFVVFDQDSRGREYRDTVCKIKEISNNKVQYFAITSVPCFEFWFFLHFSDSTASYDCVR